MTLAKNDEHHTDESRAIADAIQQANEPVAVTKDGQRRRVRRMVWLSIRKQWWLHLGAWGDAPLSEVDRIEDGFFFPHTVFERKESPTP